MGWEFRGRGKVGRERVRGVGEEGEEWLGGWGVETEGAGWFVWSSASLTYVACK